MSHTLLKYLAGGVVNTVLGYCVIFFAMYLGVSPIASNLMGYAFGLLLSFTINKYFVFSSNGSALNEGYKFFVAFALSVAANVVVLHLLVTATHLNAYLAQIMASSVYTVSMWFCSKLIFNTKRI